MTWFQAILRKKMLNFRMNLNSIIFAVLVMDIFIMMIECEGKIFRIRKCCPENELISERDSECVEHKLLRVNNHLYFMNETESAEVLGSDAEPKNSCPWWFPPASKIISKQNNESVPEFPKKYQLIAGQGLPCSEEDTSIVPAYYYNFSFYDDGSLILHPGKEDEYQLMTTKIFEPLSFCVDRIELNDDISNEDFEPVLDIPETEDHVVMLCPCTKATCVLKCCKPGMLFDMRDGRGKNSCVKNTGDDWRPVYSKDGGDSDYFLLERMPNCKPGESIVVPNYPKTNGPGYVIFSNGSARVEGETFISQPMEFCGDNIIDSEDKKIHNRILRCYPRYGIKRGWSEVKRILYGWVSVVGAIFLCLTLMVHYSLPTLRKLHDDSLIYQTWCLFIGYISVATIQLAALMLPQGICSFFGFLIQYCFLAAFFWLNVLCFDISYTFSSLRLAHGCHGQHMQKKNIFYLIYGWLAPGFIVFVTIVMEYYPGVSDYLLKPDIAEGCWFKKGSLAKLAYFYGPIATLLAINFFLFLYTTFKIMQARSDISTTIRSRNVENQRFLLYLKLFILMGLSWITELISWVVGGPEYYWFIPDTINLLRAVFIFVIICCKKQVFEELKKRIGLKRDSNVRRPSNTRSSSVPVCHQYIESHKYPNNADSSL